MWKSMKQEVPRGNVNIIITDKNGGFCLIKTPISGDLPSQRFMMKTHNSYYYSSKGLITQWMEIGILRMLLCSDMITDR
jgi:hypothetical protein